MLDGEAPADVCGSYAKLLVYHDLRMLFSKEYVGYLARELTNRMIARQLIETSDLPGTTARVNAVLTEEMSIEDRINDEVRVILEQYQDDMRKTGASYQEMFKKVKQQLVQKYRVVL